MYNNLLHVNVGFGRSSPGTGIDHFPFVAIHRFSRFFPPLTVRFFTGIPDAGSPIAETRFRALVLESVKKSTFSTFFRPDPPWGFPFPEWKEGARCCHLWQLPRLELRETPELRRGVV